MSDIVAEIIAEIDMALYDLGTAEGRASLDEFLREKVRQIPEEDVRDHAGEMIRQYRFELYWQADQVFRGRHGMTGPYHRDRSVEIKTLRRPYTPPQGRS